ncbi:MAG: carboxypeptidase-like regulatory domain-containing protein [Thermoguttaceae bacterium]
MRVSLVRAVSLSVVMGLVGCTQEMRREGPEMVKVSGVVTLDGEPLEGAHIRFSPEVTGPAAFAVTDQRGRYELRTFDPGDGAIPGKYGISVTKEVTEGGKEFESQTEMEAYLEQHGKNASQRTTRSVVPEKYSSKSSSGLTAEINLAKDNRFNLDLTSK